MKKKITLKLEELLSERFQTNEIGTDDHGRRVVGAVVVGTRFIVRIVPLLVALAELRQTVGCLGAHGPTEIAEGGRIVQIQFVAVVIGQNPGKDGILHEIVVGATGQRVEVHEILEVGDLAAAPALRHRRLAHERRQDSGALFHVGRPFLTGHRLTGRVRQSRGRGQQPLVDFVARVGRERQQVVASVVGEHFQGDGLQQVAPFVHFADVFVADGRALVHGFLQRFLLLHRRVGRGRAVARRRVRRDDRVERSGRKVGDVADLPPRCLGETVYHVQVFLPCNSIQLHSLVLNNSIDCIVR